jgi:hypothetical protein
MVHVLSGRLELIVPSSFRCLWERQGIQRYQTAFYEMSKSRMVQIVLVSPASIAGVHRVDE